MTVYNLVDQSYWFASVLLITLKIFELVRGNDHWPGLLVWLLYGCTCRTSLTLHARLWPITAPKQPAILTCKWHCMHHSLMFAFLHPHCYKRLCNFAGIPAGASFFYQEDNVPYQQQEVRAYGLLLKDLVARLESTHEESQLASCQQQQTTLHTAVQKCAASTDVVQRPKFEQIVQLLKSSC